MEATATPPAMKEAQEDPSIARDVKAKRSTLKWDDGDFSDGVARKMAKHAEELMGGGKAKHTAINEAIQKFQQEDS
jgi:hypothetical protein